MKRTRREGKKKRARRGDGACSPVIIVARVTFGRSRVSTRAAVRLSFPFERDHGRGPPFSARSLRASRCVLARDRRAFERVSVSSAFQPRAGLETETEPGASIETRGDQRSGTSDGRAGTPIAPSEIFSPRICLFGQKCHRNAGIPTGGAGEYRSRDRIDRSRLQDRDARVETRRISKAPQIFEATRKICAQLALFAKNLPVDWHFFPHCRACDRPPTAVAKAWKIEISSARSSSLLHPVDRVR